MHTQEHKWAFEQYNRVLDEDDWILEQWVDEHFPSSEQIPDDVRQTLAGMFAVPVEQGFADATIEERLKRVYASRMVKASPNLQRDTLIERLRRGPPRLPTKICIPTNETELMDSYRSLLCLRCFVYDCRAHGYFTNPKSKKMKRNGSTSRRFSNSCAYQQMAKRAEMDASNLHPIGSTAIARIR